MIANRHMRQPWYWAAHKTRIQRAEFYAYGGFGNPKLFRKMQGGKWTYWKEA